MTNKQTALAVVEQLLNGHDPSAVDRYFRDPYVQHNPVVPDGVAGIKKAITLLPDLHFDVHKVVASGDWVSVASKVTGQGDTTKVIVDTFRFEDGKVAEHWDVTQDEAAAPVLVRSSPEPLAHDAVPVVEKALDELFTHRDPSSLDRYWAVEPPVPVDVLTPQMSYEPGVIFGEGNEVFVHARFTGFMPVPLIAAYILRLDEHGKIIAHWHAVQEEVPAESTANGNPMTTPRLTV
ncbi:nuclear transport factor 2 family protein [Amycolatopsis sp. NPDC003731]